MKSLHLFAFETLTESVQNLHDTDKIKKAKYVDQVWDILQDAYSSQGGIKGSGFKSKQDMIDNIPFWKLDIIDGNVVTVLLYKYKKEWSDGEEFRKLIALGINRDYADKAKIKLYNILKNEFERSILEVSGLMLNYLHKNFKSKFDKYILTVDQAQDILRSDELKPIDKNFYKRNIGGEWHEKVMLGTVKSKY